MSGKSTYMRQIALIVLLAQIGSFVPARAAEITPVDRIFTRVGASDDIAGGRSTFMVEMDELATVLRNADENTLVLLDEVGRGTSTADGLAIAQAIAEYLHDERGALTLFATHHHPLTGLADDLAGAFTLHFSVSHDDGITFDHEIEPGAADGSYGIDVATVAGVPDPVVDRAETIAGARAAEAEAEAEATADGGDDPTDVAMELRALDIAHLTPVEALAELDRLQRLLEE
jgi:DNA mismatch repair protein MutS